VHAPIVGIVPDNTRSNRAVVLHGPGDLRIEDRPVPAPGPRELLVEVTAVGVCGSDVHYYEHGRIGARVVRSPLVLGHETCGRVVELGERAAPRELGQRVCIEPGIPCGDCRECQAGRYNLCPDVRFHGTPPIDGSLTNYLAVHEDFVFPLPRELSDDAGALMEPLAVAVWACRRAHLEERASVLVTGAGPIGLLVAQTARALGAEEVVITDVSSVRVETARRMGFDCALDVSSQAPAEQGVEVDALIECSGQAAALAGGIACLRPAGTAVLVGMGATEVTLPLDLLQRRELIITGTFRYAHAFPEAIALAADGRVDVESLISARFPLERTEAALRASRDDPAMVKAVVHPGA
jgi:L-iditol 2-dehydrogenase